MVSVHSSKTLTKTKAQVQVDQGPSHKTRYTKSKRRETGKEPQAHGYRGKCPEHNTTGLCSKINK